MWRSSMKLYNRFTRQPVLVNTARKIKSCRPSLYFNFVNNSSVCEKIDTFDGMWEAGDLSLLQLTSKF